MTSTWYVVEGTWIPSKSRVFTTFSSFQEAFAEAKRLFKVGYRNGVRIRPIAKLAAGQCVRVSTLRD